jgi:hypothetical protein
LSSCPSTAIRLCFFDEFTAVNKDFLSHFILTLIVVCTAKKQVLFRSRDVDCDSTHAVTTLSLLHFSTKDTRYCFPQKTHLGYLPHSILTTYGSGLHVYHMCSKPSRDGLPHV